MKLTQKQIEALWGEEAVEILGELTAVHGGEKLLDPLPEEELESYLSRSERAGLVCVVHDVHILADVQKWKQAEARGIPVYQPNPTEPEYFGEHLRAVPVSERLATYRAQQLQWTVVPE